MQTLSAKWTGIRPLVMHNGALADPMNPSAKEIRSIVSKSAKKLTDADYLRRDRIEWEASLYWNDECGIHIPSDNIERCIQLGAQKSRLGKDVQAAVFVADDIVPIRYTGPKSKDKMFEDNRFVLRKPVSVNASRMIRVRPLIPTGWSLEFSLEYDETIINEADLKKAMIDAGALIGLGDWRPKYGRFLVE